MSAVDDEQVVVVEGDRNSLSDCGTAENVLRRPTNRLGKSARRKKKRNKT